jgi:hypothetical protein
MSGWYARLRVFPGLITVNALLGSVTAALWCCLKPVEVLEPDPSAMGWIDEGKGWFGIVRK